MKGDSQRICINLLSFKKDANKKKSQQFLGFALLVLSSLLLIGGGFYITYQKKLEIRDLRQLNEGIEAELLKFGEYEAELESPALIQAKLTKKRELVEQVESIQSDYAGMLGEIEQLLLPDITIAQVEADRRYVSMQAYAPSNKKMVDFISQLKSNPYFMDIEKLSSQLLEDGRIAFELSMSWKEAAP